MNRSKFCLLALSLLACALMVTAVQARTWYVPSQVQSVTKAIALASAGDVIEVAVGVHKVDGYGHRLTPGITIRSDTGMPGAVVFEESTSHWAHWRNDPVFILDPTLSPTDEVVFENIIFQNFTLTFGPDAIESEPIFNILGGKIVMTNCRFNEFYGTALKFDGGSGEFNNCAFVRGNANPVAMEFAGQSLALNDCRFSQNSYQHTDYWPDKAGRIPGSIIKLHSGELLCNCSDFYKNGPLNYLLDVGPEARMYGCTSCMQDNDKTLFQGRVAGVVQLDCCTIVPTLWQVLPGGSFLIVEDGSPTPLSVQETTWTQVKALFQ